MLAPFAKPAPPAPPFVDVVVVVDDVGLEPKAGEASGGDWDVDAFRVARICEKCSAAARISRFAMATSSRRPVTTKTGSSPRTGVLMYVFVFARNALILQPFLGREKHGR